MPPMKIPALPPTAQPALVFSRRTRGLTLAPILIMAIVLSALSLIRHGCLESFEDLAMFDQILWNIRAGRGALTSLSGNLHLLFPHHFFGEHFSPVLYLLAWPAGLTRGPEALLIIQAALVALAAWPAGRWAAERLRLPAALAWGAWLWLALPGLWTATLYDFHMDALEPLALFLFLLALRRSHWTAWLWAGLVLAVKEDAGIYLAAAAAVFGWLTGQRRLGFAIAAGAGLYVALVVGLVMPAFSSNGKLLLGGRLLTPAGTGGLAAWAALILADPERWQALGHHLLAFGFLPLGGGLASLPAALAVGLAWLSGSSYQYQIGLHYPFTVYPLLFIGAVEGVRLAWKLAAAGRLPAAAFRLGTGIFLCGSLACAWAGHRATYADIMQSASVTRWHRLAESRALLPSIPPRVSLAATSTLIAHAARRENLSLMYGLSDAERMLMAAYPPCGGYPADDYRAMLGRLLAAGARYSLAAGDGRLLLFQAAAPRPAADPLATRLANTFAADELAHHAGRREKDADALNGWAWASIPGEPPGTLMFGPYRDYPPGDYTVHFIIRARTKPGIAAAELDVMEKGDRILGVRAIDASLERYTNLPLCVTLPTGKEVEFRCRTTGAGAVWIDRVWIEPGQRR